MNRRFLALLRTTVIWASVWAIAGAIPAFLRWALFTFPQFQTSDELVRDVLTLGSILAVAGGLCGLSFGLLLTGAERSRTIAALTLRRTALWGAFAGAAAALLSLGVFALWTGHWSPNDLLSLVATESVGAVLGAATAGGVLSIAKRPELPREASLDRLPAL